MDGLLQPKNARLSSGATSEAALLLSNSKLRMALDIGKMGAWEQDLEIGEITGTATFKAHLGLPLGAALTDEEFQAMVHPGDVERLKQAVAFSVRTKTDFQVEYRILRADGRIGHILVRGGALYDESDKPIWLMGVTQDATEREKIKDEVSLAQRRQEFLSKLSEQIGNLHDPYRIMETSARSLAQFLKIDSTGYGEVFEERNLIVVEREWSKGLFSNEGRVEKITDIGPHVFEPLRQGMPIATEDVQTDPHVSGDPEKLAFFASANVRTILTVPLLKNGLLVAVFYVSSSQPRAWPSADIALVQDTADRTWMAIEKVRADIRAREAEERLRMATESSPALIWNVDRDLRLTYANERWNAFLDRPLDQPSQLDWQSLVHPDDLAELINGEIVHRERRIPHTLEIRYLSPDGVYRWHLVRAVPVIGENGEFSGWNGISIDIHDYKLAKEKADRQTLKPPAG